MQHPARQIPFRTLWSGLEDRVERGLVRRVAPGKEGSLALYVYSEQCVFENAWDEYTSVARGLVIDTLDEELVATPFPKFFNYGQLQSIPDLPFDVYDKVDGSLIIIFWHDGQWKTATKGSFNSNQAKWAQERLKLLDTSRMLPGVTYLCEAVYPSNRIVVDYNGKDALILLGGYWDDGTELSFDQLENAAFDIGFELVRRYDAYNHISELLEVAKTLPKDVEGFVLRFEDGFRLKIKGDEYCRIHRMISHCTPLALWELMKNGQADDMMNYRKELPDEFHEDFDIITMKLGDKLNELVERTADLCAELKEKSDKEVGLLLHTFPEDIRGFVFPYRKNNGDLMLGRPKEALFKAVRPTANYLEGYQPSTSINRVMVESL